eukprot:TRINITY_DN39243_c0_g1_i2.p1 TRINITY_DN39243_c0_g1~~TRINITY_DN39243_c0_g1_i2.p1  ORF type:complete len:380 (+),score=127.86 TRINITY_DN39243_c0_g1_i2:163-1140(+)
MVAAALPYATGDHRYQQEVAQLAVTLLSAARSAAQVDVSSLVQQAEIAQAAINDAKQALEAAQAAAKEALLGVGAAQAQVKEHQEKVKQARRDEAQADAARNAAVADREDIAGQKAAADSAVASVKACWEGEAFETPAETIRALLAEARAEKTLLETCSVALAVPKNRRGEFDSFSLEAISEVLSTSAAALAEQLVHATALARDAQAEALGCEALREVEEERRDHATAVVEAAEKLTEAKEADVEAARHLVESREAERSKFLVQEVLAQERAALADAALAALDRLRNLASQDQDAEMTEAPKEQQQVLVASQGGEVLRNVPQLGA